MLYLLCLKPYINNHSLILYYHHKKIKGGCLCLNYIILKKILLGMTRAQSSVACDIARELEDKFDFVQHDSNVKRIRRFYNNKLFDGENFYDALIKHVIFNYKKKHKDFRVHIIIGHMFSHDNYTTLMMSMRVGKHGISLGFRSFKGQMMLSKKV